MPEETVVCSICGNVRLGNIIDGKSICIACEKPSIYLTSNPIEGAKRATKIEKKVPRTFLHAVCNTCNEELIFPFNPKWDFMFQGMIQAKCLGCNTVLTIINFPAKFEGVYKK